MVSALTVTAPAAVTERVRVPATSSM